MVQEVSECFSAPGLEALEGEFGLVGFRTGLGFLGFIGGTGVLESCVW